MSLDLSHTFQKAKTKQTGKLNLKDTADFEDLKDTDYARADISLHA